MMISLSIFFFCNFSIFIIFRASFSFFLSFSSLSLFINYILLSLSFFTTTYLSLSLSHTSLQERILTNEKKINEKKEQQTLDSSSNHPNQVHHHLYIFNYNNTNLHLQQQQRKRVSTPSFFLFSLYSVLTLL